MRAKFITLNLFDGGNFFINIKSFLKKENPDILVLQEAYQTQTRGLPENFYSLQVLQEILPKFYHHFSPELLFLDNGKEIEVGNAVFSRFPITDNKTIFYDVSYKKYNHTITDRHDFSRTPKNLQYVQLAAEDKIINVFNTHGIWGFHGNDTKRRLKMGEIIINEIKDRQNVILAGDFNLFPNTKTVKNIEKYLVNVFKNSLVTTFNMRLKPHPGNYSESVVDMVFISRNIKIINKYEPDIDVSDHFPLVCELEI